MTPQHFDLDKYFRQDSKARVVAERLLEGKPLTRQELVKDLDLAVTSTNRVVDMLIAAGCIIEREVAPDGRQTVFHFTGFGMPSSAKIPPQVGQKVTIVGGFMAGAAPMVDFKAGKSLYRGQMANLQRQVPLGLPGTVRVVREVQEGVVDVEVLAGGKTMRIDSVRNVTDAN